MDGRPALAAGLSEEERAVREIECGEPDTPGRLGAAGPPAEPSGDHEMDHQEQPALERPRRSVSPCGAALRPAGLRPRRWVGPRFAARTGSRSAPARAAGRRSDAPAPRGRRRRPAAQACRGCRSHVLAFRCSRIRSASAVDRPGTAASSPAVADRTPARLPKRSSSRRRRVGPTPGMSSSSEVMVRCARRLRL